MPFKLVTTAACSFFATGGCSSLVGAPVTLRSG
jgi:hypothetical protein